MAVLVTGATGLIGRAVTNSLLDDKEQVRVLSRDPENARKLFGGRVEAIAWCPAFQPLPGGVLDGVDVIFHLMGEPVGGRWTASKLEQLTASRVLSARKLADAVRGRRCRFISASSFGIYRGLRDEIYDETAPLGPPETQVQSLLQAWEQAVLSAESAETRVNMVRFGMVCSRDGYPKKLIRLFRRGAGFIAGDGEQVVPIVDIDDAVGMLRWVASGQAGDGPVNCVSPALPRFSDVARSIARHIAKPVRFRIPNWLARPILGGSADYFLLSYRVIPRKALDRGYNFRHSDPDLILRRAILGA
jgi:uncharacterized protein (TIGR01777 family)